MRLLLLFMLLINCTKTTKLKKMLNLKNLKIQSIKVLSVTFCAVFFVKGLATIPVSAFYSPQHRKDFEKYIRFCFVKV